MLGKLRGKGKKSKFDTSSLSHAAIGISYLCTIMGLLYLNDKNVPFLILVALLPIVTFAHGKLLYEATKAGYKAVEKFTYGDEEK